MQFVSRLVDICQCLTFISPWIRRCLLFKTLASVLKTVNGNLPEEIGSKILRNVSNYKQNSKTPHSRRQQASHNVLVYSYLPRSASSCKNTHLEFRILPWAKFEVLDMVGRKVIVSRNVKSCILLEVFWSFRRICCLLYLAATDGNFVTSLGLGANYLSALLMNASGPSEPSVHIYQTAWHHIPEYNNLYLFAV